MFNHNYATNSLGQNPEFSALGKWEIFSLLEMNHNQSSTLINRFTHAKLFTQDLVHAELTWSKGGSPLPSSLTMAFSTIPLSPRQTPISPSCQDCLPSHRGHNLIIFDCSPFHPVTSPSKIPLPFHSDGPVLWGFPHFCPC